jgi:DNA-binding transcriptional MerR regulator
VSESEGRALPKRPLGREFYTIGEVCQQLGIKAHVLRYWETQFPELAPAKNRAGNRLYRPRDVETIALIQSLVHGERFTIAGARRRLKELREGAPETAAPTPTDSPAALKRSTLAALRAEIEGIAASLEIGRADD